MEVYIRADGLWDWRLIAPNGEILCGSAQGYTQRSDAVEGYERSRQHIIYGVLGSHAYGGREEPVE